MMSTKICLIDKFWKLIEDKYGNPNVTILHVPAGILGNFDNKYLTYNSEGQVIKGYKRLKDAISACKKEEGVYLARILD